MAKSKTTFSPAEVAKMKEVIAQQEPEKPREFDLNHPPQEPYRFEEFPKMLYHHATARTIVCDNAEHEKELVAGGWSTKASPEESRSKRTNKE